MAKEASFRICKAEVELLTEREHLDMIEGAVRGGVCSVYEMRKFTANNIYQIMTLHNPRHLASAWTPITNTVASCRMKNSLSQILR